MSYWVRLNDPETGETVAVDRHAEGGTYVLGGTPTAELNVTYNYAKHFHEAWEGVGGAFDGEGDGTLGKMLGSKRAGDVLPCLVKAVNWLGDTRDPDYWKATMGNAGYALRILRDWAIQHPDAVFEVT